MMNFEDIKFGLNTVQWIVMAALGLYAWIIRRDSASKSDSDEKFIKMESELVSMQTRLVQLEVEMKNMPSEITVRELIGQLASLKAYHEGNKSQLDQMQHSVNRLTEFLLKQR